MPCYHPIKAWYSKQVNEKTGKRSLVFREKEGQGNELEVPCQKCIGCRLEYSRQWAIRGVHEAQMHDEAYFLTLTYNDENLPQYESLKKDDFQNFLKRYWKYLWPTKIRYIMCGEYGDNSDRPWEPNILGRPHYHAIIYG
jgi:hypothetical protein